MAPAACDAACQTDVFHPREKNLYDKFLPSVEFDFESNLPANQNRRYKLKNLILKMYSQTKNFVGSSNEAATPWNVEERDGGSMEDDGWEYEDSGYSATEKLNNGPKYQTYLTLVDVEEFEKEEPLSSPDEPLFDTTPTGTPTNPASPPIPEVLSEEERVDLERELDEVNTDILALRETLQSKEIKQREIKRKLGITPMGEFTNKAKQSWGNVQQSTAYNKTKTGLQTAGQKTGAAFTSFGSVVTRKLGEVRGSTAFKSFEERVSSAATSVKSKVVRNSQDGDTFQDALNESPTEGETIRTSQSADSIPLNS
ncbi:tumor protein D54-like isoform X2 [Apostichopus japonicus]|uniref:tumor protein D54-like isoform X2 n=1 Tax=Stichopus japonicus TaxID=307972 RepID=UPI003AB119B0